MFYGRYNNALLSAGDAMTLRKAAEALIKHWEAGEFQNCTGDMAGHIRLLRQALAQPEWVGLTDDEFEQAVDGLEDLRDCWIQIEAKLKEKNR